MPHRILTPVLRRVVLVAAAGLGVLIALLVYSHRAVAPTTPGVTPTWPSAATTGVPRGVALRATGGLTVTADGTVLTGLDIQGCVHIRANHVTLKNSRVRGGECGFAQVTIESGFSGALIEDSEIDGQKRTEVNNDGTGICCGGFTALRLNIHGNVDGAIVGAAYGTTVMDSWIHDLYQIADSHNQDILSNGGIAGIVIRHNRLENQLNEVGVIDLFGDFAPVQRVTVDDNLLDGGGYTLYGGCDPKKTYGTQCASIAFTNNHFMRTPEPGAFYPLGGYRGTLTSFNGKAVTVTGDDPAYRASHDLRWSGNVWDDSGTPVGP